MYSLHKDDKVLLCSVPEKLDPVCVFVVRETYKQRLEKAAALYDFMTYDFTTLRTLPLFCSTNTHTLSFHAFPSHDFMTYDLMTLRISFLTTS